MVGPYKLAGSRVMLAPDSAKKKQENLHVRMAVEWIAGHWRDAIIVMKVDDKGEPWNTTYYKILDKAPE